MTNHHAEDGDKKSILDARIERAYANEYDAAFAAATIKNYASLPLATILADHPQLLKRCTKIMGDPDIRKLTDPYAPKRDNDSYVLTVGCLAHMLTALDTKLKLEWEPDERHELESKRNTLRTALFLPLDGLKRCNVELNTQARQKPGTTGQKTPRPHAAIVDRNRYNRMTAHFSAEGAAKIVQTALWLGITGSHHADGGDDVAVARYRPLDHVGEDVDDLFVKAKVPQSGDRGSKNLVFGMHACAT